MNWKLLRLYNVSIFDQLLLEERLLREEKENFCLLNSGSSPAVVTGISGKPEEWVDSDALRSLQIPLIRRFSGGGTVVVDQDTLFVSIICNKETFSFPSYPEKILRWSEEVYRSALGLEDFRLHQNDFVIGNRKCGGNAQYIIKDRWIQHTSFLWRFSKEKMSCLLPPPKTPPYREGRSHENFLCTLEGHFPKQEDFFEKIESYWKTRGAESYPVPEKLQGSRISTHYIDPS